MLSIQAPAYQLPYITLEILKHFKTKKRAVSSIKDLLLLSEEDRRALVRTMSDEEYSVMNKVAKQFPTLYVEKAYFSGILTLFLGGHSL